MQEKNHLITASLLNAWKYLLENEYATKENFLQTLNRVSQPTTEAQKKGFDFEDWAMKNYEPTLNGQYQVKASKNTTINGIDFCLYGRFDCLKNGVIYDFKHTSQYEVGKFYGSYQTSMYLELCPEAKEMTYIIGKDIPKYRLKLDNEEMDNNQTPQLYDLYTETYSREEVEPINSIIKKFLDWLEENNLLETYLTNW